MISVQCMACDAAGHYVMQLHAMCILVVTPGIVYQYACNIDVLGPMCKLWICNSYCSHCGAEGLAPRVFIPIREHIALYRQ